MIVESYMIDLYIYESYSLKDKRRVVKSIIEKIRKRFNVSIAEVANNEIWNKATLGIACVSNSSLKCEQIINQVVDFIDNVDYSEIINVIKY